MSESDTQQSGGQVIPDEAQRLRSIVFYERAIWRMQQTILVAGIAMVALVAWKFGGVVALGTAFGVALSWQNFRWLTKTVNALGERITTGQSRERGGLIVFRFTLRILLIAIGAYVIFKLSLGGLYGFLSGLCVPVVAMFAEAAYELFAALRRGL